MARIKHEVRTLSCGCVVGNRITNYCEVLHTRDDPPKDQASVDKEFAELRKYIKR